MDRVGSGVDYLTTDRMSDKHIEIWMPAIEINFDRWFGWYKRHFVSKEQAVKVWERIIKKEGQTWDMDENPDDYQEKLTGIYFDDITHEATNEIEKEEEEEEEKKEQQSQICSASNAETLPTKNS